MGGVSGAAKPFIEKRYGHVIGGWGGRRSSSKIVFYKKNSGAGKGFVSVWVKGWLTCWVGEWISLK